jgi:fructose-1,6-bisphosphatase/inositol monophosphatase family enzyme
MVLDDNQLVESMLRAVSATFALTQRQQDFLSSIDPSSIDSNNQTRRIDRFAQNRLKDELRIAFSDRILFAAEEPEVGSDIPDDLTESAFEVAILDPIDGTDLWMRGFGNWCISTAIFDPEDARIRAAFVGYSSGDIYYATRDGAYLCDGNGNLHPLSMPQLDVPTILRDATVCFYGQKPANFLALQQKLSFLQLLQDIRVNKKPNNENEEAAKFRIYNLGGNPMMVRMTESSGMHAAVDAVFEVKGQKPYDFVPGAFIACQAGATIVELADKWNSPFDLHGVLRNHKQRRKYVLAATAQLADELAAALGYKRK